MPNRRLESLVTFVQGMAALANKSIRRGSVFAKILTANDDAGKHGVLVPMEGYTFFPELEIVDPGVNATTKFGNFDCVSARNQVLAYKYYQRYPERRITCLNSRFNDREHGTRLGLFVKVEHQDGTAGYYTDVVLEHLDADFPRVCSLLFGEALPLHEGAFIVREVDSGTFVADEALDDLLARFDAIRERGWIDSLRAGTTGIGYTFETLAGIEENNDREADFRGIEIKCKSISDSGGGGGKINLFQQAPRWAEKMTSFRRLQLIGQVGVDDRYKCYSQVTTTANNLGLWLRQGATPRQIDLLKDEMALGDWPFPMLEKRLSEKHSRAVFVKAGVRNTDGVQRFHYRELVYCERPSIDRFAELVKARRIVFEFLMSEKAGNCVRNHGYPWRLLSDDNLSDLFSLRIKLR